MPGFRLVTSRLEASRLGCRMEASRLEANRPDASREGCRLKARTQGSWLGYRGHWNGLRKNRTWSRAVKHPR